MVKPETRSINQCTYNPIKARHGFVPDKPFVKLGIPTTVFHDRDVSEFVLDRVVTSGAHRDSTYGDLVRAVRLAWDGEVSGAGRIFRGIAMENVVNFAKDALEIEASPSTGPAHRPSLARYFFRPPWTAGV